MRLAALSSFNRYSDVAVRYFEDLFEHSFLFFLIFYFLFFIFLSKKLFWLIECNNGLSEGE